MGTDLLYLSHGLIRIIGDYITDEYRDHEKYLRLASDIRNLKLKAGVPKDRLQHAEFLVMLIARQEQEHAFKLQEVKEILEQI